MADDDDVYAKRVSLGAKLLDEEHPDWYTKINVDWLDMGNGDYFGTTGYHCGCVGAQLDFYTMTGDGEYDNFVREMGLATFKSTVQLGFSLDDNDLNKDDLWKHLTELWKKEINERLAKSTQ